jgi:hypothetical protein
MRKGVAVASSLLLLGLAAGTVEAQPRFGGPQPLWSTVKRFAVWVQSRIIPPWPAPDDNDASRIVPPLPEP